MKQVIAIITVLSILISSMSFASIDNKETKHRITTMLDVLQNETNSPVIEKLILMNIATAYEKANLADEELREKIVMKYVEFDKTEDFFTPAEKGLFESKLNKASK